MSKVAIASVFVAAAVMTAYLFGDCKNCGQAAQSAQESQPGQGDNEAKAPSEKDEPLFICPQFEFANFEDFCCWLCQECPDGDYVTRDYECESATATICGGDTGNCEPIAHFGSGAEKPVMKKSAKAPKKPKLKAIDKKGKKKPKSKDSKTIVLPGTYLIEFTPTGGEKLFAEIFPVKIGKGQRIINGTPMEYPETITFLGREIKKPDDADEVHHASAQGIGDEPFHNYRVSFIVENVTIEATVVTKN